MLKALLRKQFAELGAFYFTNRKTGKRRTGTQALLYGLLFIGILATVGFSFFSIAMGLADAFVPSGLSWFYFAIIGGLSVLLGVFGSVFNTYSALYHAKDNELLLSMPIPPLYIMTARLISIFTVAVVYSALAFVPGIIAYAIAGGAVLGIVTSVVGFAVVTGLVLVLTCFLGWIIALISSKLKNKSIITVIISLVAFFAYYAVCFNSSSIFGEISAEGGAFAEKVKASFYPAFVFGEACSGSVLYLVISLATMLLLLAVTCLIMARSFIGIVTKHEASATVKYEKKPLKKASVKSALLRKEFKRFASSATYMLNCSLGTVFMLVGAVVVIIGSQRMNAALAEMNVPAEMLAVAVALAVTLVSSMNDLTSPSISLEGKHIWVLQSMPVDVTEVFGAKIKLHCIMTLPSAVIFAVTASVVLGIGIVNTLAVTAYAVAYVILTAYVGLATNLRHPILTWTNETAPIKQSLSVFLAIFGGSAVSFLFAVGGYFAVGFVPAFVYYICTTALLVIAIRLIRSWVNGSGVRIFLEL